MNRILLITRPDHDITTRYLSIWSKKVTELAVSLIKGNTSEESSERSKRFFLRNIQNY